MKTPNCMTIAIAVPQMGGGASGGRASRHQQQSCGESSEGGRGLERVTSVSRLSVRPAKWNITGIQAEVICITIPGLGVRRASPSAPAPFTEV